jgi:hypothetical protein
MGFIFSMSTCAKLVKRAGEQSLQQTIGFTIVQCGQLLRVKKVFHLIMNLTEK